MPARQSPNAVRRFTAPASDLRKPEATPKSRPIDIDSGEEDADWPVPPQDSAATPPSPMPAALELEMLRSQNNATPPTPPAPAAPGSPAMKLRSTPNKRDSMEYNPAVYSPEDAAAALEQKRSPPVSIPKKIDKHSPAADRRARANLNAAAAASVKAHRKQMELISGSPSKSVLKQSKKDFALQVALRSQRQAEQERAEAEQAKAAEAAAEQDEEYSEGVYDNAAELLRGMRG